MCLPLTRVGDFGSCSDSWAFFLSGRRVTETKTLFVASSKSTTTIHKQNTKKTVKRFMHFRVLL